MVLQEYIVIKDLTAVQVPLRDNSIEALCEENDYVLERYVQGTIGANIDYHYKIYRNNKMQTFIKIGDWKVENIKSESAWKPKELFFDLIDPKGVSSADKILPYHWINSKNHTYIYAQFVGVSGINNLLKIANDASAHSYWLSFIKERFKTNATAKHSVKIIQLEEEVNNLKSKLDSIQSILES